MPDVEAKPAAIKKLAAGEESARHSYWLATIVTDAPLDFCPGDNQVRAPGPEAYPLFLRLEFTKLIEKLGLTAEAAPEAASSDRRIHHDRGAGDGAGTGGKLLALWRRRTTCPCWLCRTLEAYRWSAGPGRTPP